MNDPILFNILGILQTTLFKNENLPFTAMKKEDNSYQPLDGSNIAKVKIMSIGSGAWLAEMILITYIADNEN